VEDEEEKAEEARGVMLGKFPIKEKLLRASEDQSHPKPHGYRQL
jgi:hypothetical protein